MSSVVVIDAWPSRSWSTFRWTPWAMKSAWGVSEIHDYADVGIIVESKRLTDRRLHRRQP